MDLIGQETSQDEIRVIDNKVYQLQKLPRWSPCDRETEEQVCKEILDSVKECLWCRQDPTQLEGESKWSHASTSKMDAQVEFQAKTHATYNHYKGMHQDSCEKALAKVRDAHWWVLAATALLGENIECLSWSVSHQ